LRPVTIRYGFHAHSAEWDHMARRQFRFGERYGKLPQRHSVRSITCAVHADRRRRV